NFHRGASSGTTALALIVPSCKSQTGMKTPASSVPITRRDFVRTASALAASAAVGGFSNATQAADAPVPSSTKTAPSKLIGSGQSHPFLTPADKFRDVSRGEPKPYTLRGDALIQARLTPATWRLEITADATP